MAIEAGSTLYQSFEDKRWALATVGTGIVSPKLWYGHILYVWNKLTTPKLRANSPELLVGKPTYFMVALTSSMIELVNATIKYTVAPLEVGPEFALN